MWTRTRPLVEAPCLWANIWGIVGGSQDNPCKGVVMWSSPSDRDGDYFLRTPAVQERWRLFVDTQEVTQNEDNVSWDDDDGSAATFFLKLASERVEAK